MFLLISITKFDNPELCDHSRFAGICQITFALTSLNSEAVQIL